MEHGRNSSFQFETSDIFRIYHATSLNLKRTLCTFHSRRSCVYAYLWRVVFLLLHWSRLIMQNDDLLFVECVHKIKYFTESLWYSIYSEIASDFVMKVMDVMYKAKWIIRVTLFFFGGNFFQRMKFTLNVLALFHDLNTILPRDIFYNRVTEII